MAFFFWWYLFFVPEILKFFYCANLVTDEAIGCASTLGRNKIKNTFANNEAILLKLGSNVAPYEIYQMVPIVMLLWQHTRPQSLSSSKSNITICNCTGQNIQKVLKRRPNGRQHQNRYCWSISEMIYFSGHMHFYVLRQLGI